MSECSAAAKLLANSKQLPRYTSYPTAPHFHPLSGEEYGAWLATVSPKEAVSLYLHVPYCKKLCWFCGCHTRITEQYDPVSRYVPLLVREMELIAQTLGRKQSVKHIHWGGGSPSYLKPQDFVACMVALASRFDVAGDAEIAIEIDPRNVSEAQVASYAKSGINRVSIGVQDFDTSVQEAINRIQPFRMVYDLIAQCRSYGIENINLDLIYGLPKQSLESIRKTIELVLHIQPERVSLFGYAHVPWKKKNIRLIEEDSLPDEALRLALFAEARNMLTEAGYIAVGLDHFAKPTDSMAVALGNHTLRRNFQGYTTDNSTTLIGLGASAIGNFAQGYAQNNLSLEEYAAAIEGGVLPIVRGFAVSNEDVLRRSIIEQIMCYMQVDLTNICKKHNTPIHSLDAPVAALRYMQEDGLIAFNDSVIKINPAFPQAARMVSAVFDTYHTISNGKHSQVA